MDPSKTRQAQAHARQRHMALAPSSAPGQLRMPTSRTRGKHKSTAALVPQGVQPSSQRPYQQSFNGVPQKRKIPAHHHYDRQPQFVGTPEDVEDDDLLYPDEEFVLFLLSLTYLLTLFPFLFIVFTFSHFHFSLFTPTCLSTCFGQLCILEARFVVPFPIPSISGDHAPNLLDLTIHVPPRCLSNFSLPRHRLTNTIEVASVNIPMMRSQCRKPLAPLWKSYLMSSLS
jgi:hypothetical protein